MVSSSLIASLVATAFVCFLNPARVSAVRILVGDSRQSVQRQGDLSLSKKESGGVDSKQEPGSDAGSVVPGGSGSGSVGSAGMEGVPPEDQDEYLAAIVQGPADQDEIEKKIAAATEKHFQEVAKFGKMLPYRPQGMPYESFKQRCMGFVQGLMKKASYNEDRLPYVMPKCIWDQGTCDTLIGELKSAMKTVDMPSHALVAPAEGSGPAIATGESFSKGSGPPTLPEGVSDDVAAVYADCRKEGGSPDACGKEAEAVEHQALIFKSVSSAEVEDTGRLEEPVKEGAKLFKWCDQIYNLMEEKKLRATVKEMVDEDNEHYDDGVDENPEKKE